MDEFQVPGEPEELWSVDSQLAFKVEELVNYEENQSALGEATESMAFVLCDQDPLCIVEQQNFDQLCSIVRCFQLLEASKRRQLLDALCSSLTCLNAWIDRLLSSPADTIDRVALAHHRSAFKAYLFFLHWIGTVASREARESATTSQSASMTTAGTKGRGGRSKKAAADFEDWDWSSQFPKAMKAVAQSLNTDLWALFRPNRPDENVLVKLMQLSVAALENPSAAKNEELAAGAAHVLAACALKYQQLESVAGALVDVLNKHEHSPPLVAELLRYSVAQWDDGRLAAAVLGEVASVDPVEYERQQNATGEKAGVRSIAEFVQEMANRMPRLMANQISLLLPHLGGKAWTLRSGIVSALGYLLHKAFDNVVGQADAADAQGVAARLRSKQHLLDVLCERVRDQSSYTRKAVLQTWQYLAENRAVPLGHWQVVTEIAAGRLEDKSSLVRKEALRLLQYLMLHNPFGPSLPADRFAASLATHKAMLDAIEPPAPEDEGLVNDGMAQSIDVEGMAGAGEQQDQEESHDMEMEESNEDAQQQEEEEGQAPTGPIGKTPAEVGWDGSVEELKALVASLELAVDFVRSLSDCLPIITQLLASSTVSDVQESIAMLLTCKQFDVAGAPEAIRKMLPLVFAKDQAVKDRIIEALDQLYVSGWAGNTFTSAQAARNLVALASGASLGELGALEEVLKEFVGRGFVTPVMLHELWEISGAAHAAVRDNAQGCGRALRDLRAALAVLSFAAAHNPDAFSERHVAMLLRYGLGEGRCADALTARHACFALLRLSENFTAGLYEGVKPEMYASLVRTLVASPLPEDAWYSAAESSITAIYSLHPTPELLCAAVLRRLAARATVDGTAAIGQVQVEGDMETEEEGPALDAVDGEERTDTGAHTVSAMALSRLFFVLGHVALQHLVYVERLAKSVRRQRHEAEKKAAEEKSERATRRAMKGSKSSQGDNDEEEEEDINAELGVGSVAADAELDALKDACESQILSTDALLGPYARLVSAVCHGRSLLSGDPRLRSAALLALCKLMTVDPTFCDANLQLVFTLLQNRSIEPSLRCNLIVALGDLALRFPNHLEPWTEHVYRPLGDPDCAVRKNCLMVLTHLILNDMMKVKGHIAKMAVCLEDEDPRISALAQLFFHELAKKEYKGTSPIYNLLPDILSNLSKDPSLGRGKFQSVMQQLLGYIKKDKQGDALVDKLCQRLASTEDQAQWRNVAFCLTLLPLSDKGLRRLSESFKLYKHTLADAEVAGAITGLLAKAKKSTSKAEVKQLVEELEVRISEAAAERAEEEATAEAARKRAAKDRGEMIDDDEVEEEGEASGAGIQQQRHHQMSEDIDMDEVNAIDEEGSVAAPLASSSPSDAVSLAEGIEAAGDDADSASVAVVAAVKPEPVEEAESEASQQQGQEEEEPVHRTSSRASSRRGTTSSAGSDISQSTKDDDGAVAPTRATRSGRSSSRVAAKSEMQQVSEVPVKTRATRRSKTVVEGSDSEGDDRIAAVQARVGSMKVKTEN